MDEYLDMSGVKKSSLVKENANDQARLKLREIREDDQNDKRRLDKRLKLLDTDLQNKISNQTLE